jgi:hypothetical protein
MNVASRVCVTNVSDFKMIMLIYFYKYKIAFLPQQAVKAWRLIKAIGIVKNRPKTFSYYLEKNT